MKSGTPGQERRITLLCALGALALFAAMFLRGGAGAGAARDIARPITAERRGNGYFAALSWLDAAGVRVVSLRDRFDVLGKRTDLAPTGNLLIVTLPATAQYRTEEFVPLDHWIRAGNTLLVLAALADAPDWAFGAGGLVPADVNLLTGLSFQSVRLRAQRAARHAPDAPEQPRVTASEAFRLLREPERSVLLPNGSHAYFRNLREAVALSDYAHQPWALEVPYDGFALELAHERTSGAGVLWMRPLGAGTIIVSGYGSLFTNRALGLASNATLLANLLAVHLAPRGTVLFDDGHQGLGAAYDAQKFYRDPRLYLTAAIVAGVWLAWVLGGTRLSAPRPRVPAPREADLVQATGSLLARVVRTDAAARTLFEHLLTEVPLGGASERGEAHAWEYLERHPRVMRIDLEQLRSWYAQAYAGQRVPLRKLHNLILRIEGQIRP